MTKRNIVIALAVMLGIVGVFFLFARSSSVSPEAAREACDAFARDVKAKVASVPGYKIVQEYPKSCDGFTDEAGSMDYNMSVGFRMSKVPDSTAATIRDDINDFVAQIPHNDYGILVENAPATDQPPQLCIFASRYLNNDGTYIPQGSTENKGRYIGQNEFAQGYRSSCP